VTATSEPDIAAALTHYERLVMHAMAGDLATNRAGLGEERYPWWQVWLHGGAPFHEAGHCVVGWALGWTPYRVDIIARPELKFGDWSVRGVAQSGYDPEPPADLTLSPNLKPDRRSIAENCLVLGLAERSSGPLWRGAVRAYHRLQAQTRELIEQHWPLIISVAEELTKHQELDHRALARILNGGHAE
jgi:hypothetical protein